MPSPSSPIMTPAPYTPTGTTASLINAPAGGPGTNAFGRPTGPAYQDELARSLQAAGYKGGTGTALAQFLSSGAGYNPAVANALIAALQPQFQQQQAQLMEQFGSHGLAEGSPAAYGLSNLFAQENLDVGQLLSGLYEQSVSNYLSVLSGGKVTQPSFGQAFKQNLGSSLGSGLGNLLTMRAGG
jgi:hypothetical protein